MKEFRPLLRGGLLALALALLLGPAGRAAAGSASFCKSYANTAVAHQRLNERLRCGYWGFAWHTNYNTHYNWCIKALFSTATQHQNKRAREIAVCRARKQAADNPRVKPWLAMCRGGGSMRLMFIPRTHERTVEVRLYFAKAPVGFGRQRPYAGRCAWQSRAIASGESSVMSAYYPLRHNMPEVTCTSAGCRVKIAPSSYTLWDKVRSAITRGNYFYVHLKQERGYLRVTKYGR